MKKYMPLIVLIAAALSVAVLAGIFRDVNEKSERADEDLMISYLGVGS